MVFYCVINCYCVWFTRQTQCVSVPPCHQGLAEAVLGWGDLAAAHGGCDHSKSVSFGGDSGRLFKRVHYRLVNASAEGETLQTALNSLCTLSCPHSFTHADLQTHSLLLGFTFFSCQVCMCCPLSPSPNTPTSASVFCFIASNESNTVLKVFPCIALIHIVRLNAFFCACTCVCSYENVCVCVCHEGCVKHIEGFL